MKIAYCSGFWCTNIGNSFFSLGVEHVLKRLLGEENITVVSDLQTYTNSVGKRHFPHEHQFKYISKLDVDYIVLAGPVLSRYFISLWKEILIELHERGIGYIILSAGIMKLNAEEKKEILEFFKEYPPYIFTSRDTETYDAFSEYTTHSYDGICFSFFVTDYYKPSTMSAMQPYITLNFDKTDEPDILETEQRLTNADAEFEIEGIKFCLKHSKRTKFALKTDRFSDALVYALSIFPTRKRPDMVGKYKIVRTDHRFHPHYRRRIYQQNNSFCADLPYGYLNLYANSTCTLSDRVHACAVTLAYGNSAMLFARTNRSGLLDRIGAQDIGSKPIKIDLARLTEEKTALMNWLDAVMNGESLK